MSTYREPAAEGPTGWAIFAGVILFIVGSFSTIFGLVAIFNDEVLTVGPGGGLIVWDYTAWGWIHLLGGLVLLAASMGLFVGAGWARWLAVVAAGLNAISTIGVIHAEPIWALIVVALDVIIIYQLTARWRPVY